MYIVFGCALEFFFIFSFLVYFVSQNKLCVCFWKHTIVLIPLLKGVKQRHFMVEVIPLEQIIWSTRQYTEKNTLPAWHTFGSLQWISHFHAVGSREHSQLFLIILIPLDFLNFYGSFRTLQAQRFSVVFLTLNGLYCIPSGSKYLEWFLFLLLSSGWCNICYQM